MSEYEGKVPYRKYARNVDLIDILYYEATGEFRSHEEKEKVKEKVKDILENKKLMEAKQGFNTFTKPSDYEFEVI